MGYITGKELSKKWGISQNRITKLAHAGRIEGARIYGKTWIFPEDAVKPDDGREKANKVPVCATNLSFRYPIIGLQDTSGLYPPLTDEEQRLNDAVVAFHACRFEDADELIGDLPETCKDRYIRIGALYVGCMTDTMLCNPRRYFYRYGRLSYEMHKKFPYKPEMSYLMRELDVTLGADGYFKHGFRVSPGYKYHKSFLPHLAALCAVSLSYSDTEDIPQAAITAYESECTFLEDSGAYPDLQELHFYLGVTYSYLKKPDLAAPHFRKALELAERYELYYCPALDYFYLKDILSPVLSGFPEAFRNRMDEIGENLHDRLMHFIDATSMDSFYNMLPKSDSLYAFYAVHGYSLREIGGFMDRKPGTVGTRLSAIYTALGIKGKKELMKLYEATTGISLDTFEKYEQ